MWSSELKKYVYGEETEISLGGGTETKVESTIKKISNKKTMSVILDMLKFGSTLFLERKPILFCWLM